MATFTGTLAPDPGSIKNQHVSNQVADIVSADKLQPFIQPRTNFATAIAGTPATREEIVHVASSASTIRGFHTVLTSGASTNITFDLKVNGSSVLSSTVSYTTSGTRVVKDGTLSSTSLVAGDVVSIAMTVTVSTGASGPLAWVNISETQAPS